MQNNFQTQVESGLGLLRNEQGRGGLPAAPPDAVAAPPRPAIEGLAPFSAADSSAMLDQQRHEADHRPSENEKYSGSIHLDAVLFHFRDDSDTIVTACGIAVSDAGGWATGLSHVVLIRPTPNTCMKSLRAFLTARELATNSGTQRHSATKCRPATLSIS
jgi:hypothetical protein